MRSLISGGRIYLPMLISTSVVSVISFIICLFIDRNAGKYPHFILTGAFFALFFLMLSVAVFLCEYFFQGFPEAALREKMNNHRILKSFAFFTAASFFGAFLIGGLFQFLYELEPAKNTRKAEAYAFILDNSGSMDGNDPNNMRFDAVSDICETLPSNLPVTVYVFGDETKCVRSYTSQDELPVSVDESWYEELNGTYLGDALNTCYKDTNQAKIDGIYSGTTRVIVLTDGHSADLGGWFDSGIKNAVNSAIDNDCEIFSIGFGNPDRTTLEKLSWRTNGEYYDAGDAYNIASSMNSAVNAKTRGRMLMGVRSGKKASIFWYGIMRILFVFLLGFGVSALSAMLIDYKDIQRLVFIQTAIKSFAAALILEILIQNSFGSAFVQFVACLLIGTLLLPMSNRISTGGYITMKDNSIHDVEINDAQWDDLSIQIGKGRKNPNDRSIKM